MSEVESRVYPRRNPFPITATTSQDERPAGPDSAVALLGLPTVPLPAVERVWKLTSTYLTSFPDNGQLCFVHGDHGVGKTHAVLHALDRAAELDSAPYRFYVKAENEDFVALYRRLMGQLDPAALRDISLRFLGTVAGEETGRSYGQEAEAEFLSRARETPELVYSLYDQLSVEPGAVLQSQAAELAGVVGGREDFQRALEYLRDPVLQNAAYAWLVGRDITAEEASRLGVAGPINDPQLCRYGIQLVVTMTARIGRPVIIVLDQCERLIFGRDGTISTPNVGLLHSLVEKVPLSKGMLVLVGSEDAWWDLPRDFRGRVGVNDVPVPRLTPDQAVELLAAYTGAVTGKALVNDPYPFTDDAVHMLLELSGGNTRRLLQQAWEAFDQAEPEQPITADLVARTAGQGRSLITEEDARLAIEGALFGAGVTFERNWQQNAVHADYAVPAGSSPRLLIRISQAAFATDEARAALGHASLIRQLESAGLTARVVLVVLGYCSPDVLDQLNRTAHDVIVYDGPAAVDRLRSIFTSLPGQETPEPAESVHVTGAIDALQLAVTERDDEVGRLRSDVSDLFDRFADAAEPTDRGAWKQHAQELRERIRKERKARRDRQFAELEAAHARAEQDRRNRFLAGAGTGIPLIVVGAIMSGWTRASGQAVAGVLLFAGLGVIAAGYVQLMTRGSSIGRLIAIIAAGCAAGTGIYILIEALLEFPLQWFDDTMPIVQGLLITLGTLIIVVCALALFYVIGTRRDKELGRPAGSLERLNQAARSAQIDPVFARVRMLLADADPHVRYAAIASMPLDLRRNGPYGRDLVDLFREEPTAIVRRAAARALGVAPPELIDEAIREGSDAGIPETVYLIEAASREAVVFSTAGLRTGTPMELFALIRRTPGDPASLVTVVAEAAGAGPDDELPAQLRDWYQNEREITAHSVSERFLRRAAALLSPFDDDGLGTNPGLGTFDELARIGDIDDVYLFFEQLIFYRELGPNPY
jgi:hypothetical protein